jgi:serine/threonine-protein kinase
VRIGAPASPPQAKDQASNDAVDRHEAPTLAATVRQELPKLPHVPGYEILEILGRGGMGVVYKARQLGLKRLVALKMVLAGEFASESDILRFRTEAEAVAQFHHPHIVQIYEIGEYEGKPFISLEYVEGNSLAKKIAGTPLAPLAAAQIIRDMAEAMQYAHAKGIIHRDLKPANVLLTQDGQPKITDFGLAKRFADDSGHTQTGSVLGTPSYMPPEQAEGRIGAMGPASDVYSLGAILYELLTGRAPFRAATLTETLTQVRERDPVWPTLVQPGTPRDLETICLKCLQKDPKKRYASAGDLSDDMRRYLAGEPIAARPVPRWERGWRWCRRNPLVAALSTVVACLILVTLAGSLAFSAVIYQEKKATEQESLRANANAALAADQARQAQQNEKTAIGNFELAQTKEREAVKNAARARKREDEALREHAMAINQIVNLASQTQKALRSKANDPKLEPILRPMREQLLKTVRNNVVQLAKEMGKTGLTSSSLLYSYQRLGDSLRELGMPEEAFQQFKLAHETAKKLADDDATEDRHRANLATILMRLGDMELTLKADVPAARELYQQALDLQGEVEAHPGNRFYTAVDHKRLKAFYLFHLGQVALKSGEPSTARKYFEQVVAYRRDWVAADAKNVSAQGYLAQALLELGNACWRLDDEKAMRAAFDESFRLVDQLATKHPAVADFKADVAEVQLTYAEVCLRLGRFEEAKERSDKCPALLAVALGKDPESTRYLALCTRGEYLQGLVSQKLDDLKTKEHFESALGLCNRLTAIDAANVSYQAQLALCLARVGKDTQAVGKADLLSPRVAKDPELLIELAGCYAICAGASSDETTKKKQTDKALRILTAVAAGGYKDQKYLLTDPNLAGLADNPEYQGIVDKMK